MSDIEQSDIEQSDNEQSSRSSSPEMTSAPNLTIEVLQNSEEYRRHLKSLAQATDVELTRTAREVTTARQQGDPEHGVFLNIAANPAGLGTWRWVNPEVDAALALRLGFDRPSTVESARRHSALLGTVEGARPFTLWTPQAEYFNPRRQLQGAGQWAFHTEDDEARAHTNFGRATNLGPNVPVHRRFNFSQTTQPTADDIWGLRRMHFLAQAGGLVEVDQTRTINLV